MGIISGIVGAGMNAAASIFGGIQNAKAMKAVRNSLNQQMKENQDLYDRRYNEDATQRADAQRLLTMTEESIRQRNRQSAGAQAVMGGTEESVAAAKAANNKALADATSNIAAQAEARKDAIEDRYLQNKAGLQAQINDLNIKKAQGTAEAIKGVADAAGNVITSF